MVSFVDKFADLYAKTLGEKPPPIEKLKEVNKQLSQKYTLKDATKYLIYADQPIEKFESVWISIFKKN